MENTELIIGGLSRVEMLSLQAALSDEKVQSKELTGENQRELGKNYELLTSAIIAIGITNIALKVIKLWLDSRKTKPANTVFNILLPNGTIVTLKNGKIVDKEKIIDKIEPYMEIIEGVLDSIKDVTE